VILHALFLMIVYVFQGIIFPYLRSYGLVPLLLPIATAGVAVYEGRYTGGIFGIFAGVMCDVSFNKPAILFTIVLTIAGLMIGTVADTVMTRGFATYILSSIAVLVASAFVQLFPLLFFVRVSFQPLLATALRQTAYSLLFAVPIWFFARALGKRAQRFSPSGKPL